MGVFHVFKIAQKAPNRAKHQKSVNILSSYENNMLKILD